MKTQNFITLLFVVAILCIGSCKEQQYLEGKSFVIQNKSDKEIIVQGNSILFELKNPCKENLTKSEYEDLIRDCMVSPNSFKNVEIQRIAEYMLEHPNDTAYITAFYRIDMDKIPCQKSSVIKTWKVTLADMEANGWTLVFSPE